MSKPKTSEIPDFSCYGSMLGAAKRQAVETERGFLFKLRGLFLQSVGFPFDRQGPGSTRIIKQLKTVTRPCSRTCGKNDVLGSKCVT